MAGRYKGLSAWVTYNTVMAEADHYCADCDTHFNASPEQHAETYHDGGIFRGVRNGNYRSYERRTA